MVGPETIGSQAADQTWVTVWLGDQSVAARSGTIVGRDPDGLTVDHAQVSWQHAKLVFDQGAWSLVDLGSTNGLSQGQGRIDQVRLLPNRNKVWLGPPETSPALYIDVHTPAPSPPPAAAPTPPMSAAAQPSANIVPPSPPTPSPPAPANVAPPAPAPVPIPAQNAVPQNVGAMAPHANLANPQMANNLGRRTGVVALKQLVIGRDPSCGLTLQDPLASRFHAELTIGPGGGRIKDLGSANGTYVNGQRIQEIRLNEGDLIEIAHTQFLLIDDQLEQHFAYGLPLQAQGLDVTVGDGLRILRDINFMLPAGSMTAIVGPSGSGKSTLLNALTGRRKADKGRVFLGGRDLYAAQESIGRSIGFVPQDDPVHETLSVKKALTAAAKLRLPSDTNKAEIAKDVAETAEDLGLTARLGTRVAALSGGQRKRVSVGYEMVSAPQALILDEPTSGLDPGLERDLMLNLRELANRGTTTVVVTHSVQSLELCDRVIVLAPGGRAVFIGKPDNVAAYFGCPNIASVFNLLSSRPADAWTESYIEESGYERFAAVSNASQKVSPPKRSFFKDLAVLTKRYVASLFGDKKKLAIMLLQPPLIGLIVSFTLGTSALSNAPGGLNTYYYVLITVLVMTWFGTFNSVREIVDERKVFRRERSVGVSSTAFVLSKWLVLFVVIVIQAALFHFVASIRMSPRIGPSPLLSNGELEFVLALVGVGIACVGIGLIISSLSKDAVMAVVSLPLFLISIVLFSGLLLPTEGRTGFEEASWVNPVQWGGSAAAVSIDLQNANGCNTSDQKDDESLSDFMERVLTPKLNCSDRWEPTVANQTMNFSMLSLISFVMLLLAGFSTKWKLSRPENR